LVKGEFTAVADSSLLSHVEANAIQQSDLPELSKQTLLTAWLAVQENEAWGLEAYQRVA